MIIIHKQVLLCIEFDLDVIMISCRPVHKDADSCLLSHVVTTYPDM